jgi:hypothetical protein
LDNSKWDYFLEIFSFQLGIQFLCPRSQKTVQIYFSLHINSGERPPQIYITTTNFYKILIFGFVFQDFVKFDIIYFSLNGNYNIKEV